MTENERRLAFLEDGRCVIEDFAPPSGLEPGQVLVRNEVSLVSPGTELAVLRKRHRAFRDTAPSPWTTFPFHPGYVAVGRVEAAGPDTGTVAVGDRVWHPSPHSTVSVAEAARCRRVPDDIEPRDAVFFGLVEIGMTAIRRAPVQLGERVLVSGLGIIGMLVARLYVLSGGRVAGADFSRGRLQRGSRLGVGSLIDLNDTSLVDWYSAHSGLAPQLAVEAAGVESNIDACLKVTVPGGRVVLQGSPRRTMEIDPYNDIHLKGLTVIGAHVITVPKAVRDQDAPFVFELCHGGIGLDEIRTHELPYLEAPQLYDRLEDSLDDYLGVVLTY